MGIKFNSDFQNKVSLKLKTTVLFVYKILSRRFVNQFHWVCHAFMTINLSIAKAKKQNYF